jgi:uncharacterized protein
MRAVLLLLVCACIQTDLGLFLATKTDRYALPDNHIPAERLNEITIPSTDGVTLAAFWATQEAAGSPSVVYLHGQGANLDAYWEWIMALWDRGFQVLAVDYRGFGKSDGAPSEQGLYDDGVSALAHLRGPLGAGPVLVYGYSLGTAVATYTAVAGVPDALLLEAPFTSMTEMIEGSSPYPMPADWATEIEFNTLGRIGGLAAPLVVTHGRADQRVPFRLGRELFEAAPEPKVFIPVDGTGHSNTFLSQPDVAIAAVRQLAPSLALP